MSASAGHKQTRQNFAGFAFSAYWPYEPEFTRQMFRATAKNAKAAGMHGGNKPNVVPYVSLGAGAYAAAIAVCLCAARSVEHCHRLIVA